MATPVHKETIRDTRAHDEEQHRFESDEENDVASGEEQQEECDEEEEKEEDEEGGEDNGDENTQDYPSPQRRKTQSPALPECNKRKKTAKAKIDAEIIASMARGGSKGLSEPTKRSLCEYR